MDTYPQKSYLKSKYPAAHFLQLHLKGKKNYVNEKGIEHQQCMNFLNELV